MRVEKKIGEDREFVGTVSTLVKAYEEIAVMKMQRVRSRVLSSREFAELINQVFSDVRVSYAHEIEKLTKKHEKHEATRRAGIFISAEARLYGDIIGRIFSLFIADYGTKYDDAIVIGKVGRDLMESRSKSTKYEYMEDISDRNNEAKNTLLDLIRDYDEIVVYYGKFVNVISQESVSTVITGALPVASEVEKKATFFFEPSLADVLAFFENQVVASLLLQTIHESELAKLASRTKTMEQARINISEAEKVLARELRVARKMKADKKQQERISGIRLWA